MRWRDQAVEGWLERSTCTLWRTHSDAVNGALLASWWPTGSARRLLKTDLFDEAVAVGLYPQLASRAQEVIGIDISALVIRRARSRYPALVTIEADVRCLPFPEDTFDVIVCSSTLDHFESSDEILVSLQDLRRVLSTNGHLLLTLDNRANPLVALRSALPFHLLNALGLVPYYVGATCGPRRLQRMLEEAGFRMLNMGAILHCPRVFAVALARLLERHAATQLQERYLRLLMSFEGLSRWPTRFLTGHFVAAIAVKR